MLSSLLIFILSSSIVFGKKVGMKLIAYLIGEWKKWTWMPFVVYMKVRNRHERHWKSMVTGLSKPLDHNEPFEFESNNKTDELETNLQLSMQEKLAKAIDKEMKSKKKFQITNN
jgi:hypothetical protein